VHAEDQQTPVVVVGNRSQSSKTRVKL
jgi:hypothetical protein